MSNWEQNNTIVGLLQQLIKLLSGGGGGGGGGGGAPTISSQSIITVSITGASVATAISKNPLLVKAAMIQNLSTNSVTIAIRSGTIALGSGFILNGASSTGNAGDTAAIYPGAGDSFVDLADVFFNQSGTGVTLSVWLFQ